MTTKGWTLAVLVNAMSWACGDPAAGPDGALRPSFAAGGVGRPSVLVNPNSDDNGTAKTIQEGIDMVGDGGTVMVLPGTYSEAIVIDKGLTLEGIADGSGSVIVEQIRTTPPPDGGQASAIRVATSEPVVIRDLTVHHVGVRGVNGYAAPGSPAVAVDLTIEGVTFDGAYPFPAPNFNNGVSVVNNTAQSGGRARLAIRGTVIRTDGIGVSLGGDVDAVIDGNVIGGSTPGVPGACVFVSPTGQGVTVPAGAETHVDIVNNKLEQCGTNLAGRIANGIQVTGAVGDPTTGTVNIVGNTMQNTIRAAGACNTAGINYQFYSGRIEHNTFTNVVQGCALDVAQARPAAIWVGTRTLALPPVQVTVRFNDIQGNAFAGLRIGGNQTIAINASCNYWGSANGPSSVGSSTGTDAIVLEAPAMTPTPVYLPFATAPIAGTGATRC
jgi:hypothetical protein